MNDLIVRDEIKQHEINWEYYGKCFIATRRVGSPHTYYTYMNAIRNWEKFLKESGVTRPTRADVIHYMGWMRGKEYSDFTINLYLPTIRCFFEYLSDHVDLDTGQKVKVYPNIFDGVGLKLPRIPIAPVRATLTDRDFSKLRTYLKRKKGQVPQRDLLMVELCYFGGLRAKEVSNLRIDDLKREGEYYLAYLLRKGKTQRDSNDFIYLQEGLWKSLQRYIKRYRVEGFIFKGTIKNWSKERLLPGTVSDIINTRMREAGIKTDTTSCHSLRHAFATNLIRKGVPLFAVQRAMGHSDLQSTLVYTHSRAVANDPVELALEY